MWLTLPAVLLAAAGPRPPLVLRGGGAPESELLDSLHTAKLRLHALEHLLKTKAAEPKQETSSPEKAAGLLDPVLAEPEEGDRVRVRGDVARPRFEWGEGVDHHSVGRLTWFSGARCTVDFPRHGGWNGLLAELERVAPSRDLAAVGDRVRVRRDVGRPAYGWGPVVRAGAVGSVVCLGHDTEAEDREICVVRFEGHANWTGVLAEMEIVSPTGDRTKLVASRTEPRVSAAGARLPSGALPSQHGGGGGYGGSYGERPRLGSGAMRAGWVLGATAVSISASTTSSNAQEARSSLGGRPTTRGADVLRRVGGGLAVLLAFCWTLGALLALGAALLDKPVHGLLDEALETALRLRRGLLRRPHPPLGVASATTAALPPLLRAALLLPLRMPVVFLSWLLLYWLCLRGAGPATLQEVRRGFELGFRQLRGDNAAAASAPLLARQEALLRVVSGVLRAAVGVLYAARAAAVGIGTLVLLGSYFD